MWVMPWPLEMQRKGCDSSVNDHDIDFYVTMVGWLHVQDSDGGDLRRWRDGHIYILLILYEHVIYNTLTG